MKLTELENSLKGLGMKEVFEKVENRFKELSELKQDLNALYLVSKNENDRAIIAERNMQVSMEMSFLKDLFPALKEL